MTVFLLQVSSQYKPCMYYEACFITKVWNQNMFSNTASIQNWINILFLFHIFFYEKQLSQMVLLILQKMIFYKMNVQYYYYKIGIISC